MSAFSFRLPLGEDPREAFADLPKGAKSFLRHGFATLSKAYKQSGNILAGIALSGVSSGFDANKRAIHEELGLPETEAGLLSGTLSFLAILASHPGGTTAQQFVEGLSAAGVIELADCPAATSLLESLQENSGIQSTFKRKVITDELLPSLVQFDTTVDVRLSFDSNKVELAVPVLLVHIDTDVDNREIWFQMSTSGLQKTIEQLQKNLLQMKAAESWASANQD